MPSKLITRKWLLISSIVLGLMILSATAVFLVTSYSERDAMHKDYKEIKWDEKKFTVSILATTEKKAVWEIRQGGNFDSLVVTDVPLDKAESVVEVFSKQPPVQKAHGIFIYSKSFAIPDTPQERQFMTDYLWERYHDQAWRESEAKLINDLRLLCKSKEIALYVNLSANLQSEWKRLTPEDPSENHK